MTTNLVQEVTKANDLDQLTEITDGMVGEACWKARLSYGDELSLHIGARVPYLQKSMAGKEKGAWILGTRGTAWMLDLTSETLATSNEEPEIIRQKIQVIEGTTITELETTYPKLALTVIFSNGARLRLVPSSEEHFNLPYWEVFTPQQMVLKVGPGAMWSYTPSGRLNANQH